MQDEKPQTNNGGSENAPLRKGLSHEGNRDEGWEKRVSGIRENAESDSYVSTNSHDTTQDNTAQDNSQRTRGAKQMGEDNNAQHHSTQPSNATSSEVVIAEDAIEGLLEGNSPISGSNGPKGNGDTKVTNEQQEKEHAKGNKANSYVRPERTAPLFRTLRNVVRTVVGLIVTLYLAFILFINLPPVQAWIATAISKVLSEKLHTRVELSHVDVSLTGQLVVDNLRIWDQQDEQALNASRLSVKMELDEFIKNKRIRINHAQLMGTHANIYQQHEGEPLNIQFIIDAFASKDTTTSTPIDLAIKRIVIRRSAVNFDKRWKPQTKGHFDLNHLHLSNISLTASLNELKPENIQLNVDRFSAKDASGLTLEQMSFQLLANRKLCELKNLNVKLPNSSLLSPSITFSYPHLPTKGSMGEWAKSVMADISLDLNLDPTDLTCISPKFSQLKEKLNLQLVALGNMSNINVTYLNFCDERHTFNFEGSAQLTNVLSPSRQIALQIGSLHANESITQVLHSLTPSIPESIPAFKVLDTIDANGTCIIKPGQYIADISASTSLGEVSVEGEYTPEFVNAHLATNSFNLAKLIETTGKESPIGTVAMDITVSGVPRLIDGLPNLNLKGNVKHIEVKGYDFKNIVADCALVGKCFDGLFSINDPAIQATFDGKLSAANDKYTLDGMLDVDHADLDKTGLLPKRLERTFAGHLQANLTGTNPQDLAGRLDVKDFTMTDSNGKFSIHDVHIANTFTGRSRHLVLDSPYAKGTLEGQLDFTSISHSIKRMAHLYLPSYFNAPSGSQAPSDVIFDVTIADLSPIEHFTHKHIAFPDIAHLKGSLNTMQSQMTLEASTPRFDIGEVSLRDININCTSNADNMHTFAMAQTLVKGRTIGVNLEMTTIHDHLNALLNVDNSTDTGIHGKLALEGDISHGEDGMPIFDAYLKPDTLHLGDNIGDWEVRRSHLRYSNKELQIDSLCITRDSLYLMANGLVNKNPENVITIDLGGINIEQIMELAKVRPVRFDGDATGRVLVSQLFTKPIADIHLDVPNFRFNEGNMGHASINGSWGRVPGDITLDALIADTLMDAETHVVGQIAPYKAPRGRLDLDITCRRTNLHFLNRYTQSIFSHVDGRASGHVTISGPFKQIALEGAVVCDEAEVGLPFIGVDYHLQGDSVWLASDGTIYWKDATIYDPQGNPGIAGHQAKISGEMKHNHFADMRYDIHVNGSNILAYNFPTYTEDLPFYGVVYGTGKVNVKGHPGTVAIDIEATPQKDSKMEYNVTTPDAITSSNFLHIGSRDSLAGEQNATKTPIAESKNDMTINFTLDITPDIEMRLLMDATTQDYIMLRGNGPIHAKYYNKGTFTLYGNFMVETGRYQLNLTSLAQRRDFQLQRGGTINFTGDPYDSELNLQALYEVPARVALKDLSSSSSFSDNKVPVNCLVDVNGTLRALQLNFDIDLPNASEDEKQLVRSQISTEEERYTQFIYLLAVNRFYTYDYTGTQQQSLTAVNSFVSSTLSSQFNQMLSNVIKSNKWTFGANLATGEEGWNDMDVEGQLSGSLFNDRLIINGNVGYRDRIVNTTNTNFVGDFDARYLLTQNGNLSIKAYSETNDRYFTKSSLTTQGIGIMAKKDFSTWKDLIWWKKRRKK